MLYEKPKPISDIISEIVREEHLENGLNSARIVTRFKELIGLSEQRAISKISFSKGVLYCTVTSSIVRSSIFMKKREILSRLQQENPSQTVKNIVLR